MCLDAIGKLVPTVQGGCTSPNALSTPLWFAAACPILSIDSGCSPVNLTSTASMATIRYNLTKYNYKSWWSWLISSMARRGILGNDNRLKFEDVVYLLREADFAYGFGFINMLPSLRLSKTLRNQKEWGFVFSHSLICLSA